MNEPKEKHEICPFCGECDLDVDTTQNGLEKSDPETTHDATVYCNACGASGPPSVGEHDEEKAIAEAFKFWDDRAK